MLSSLSSKNDLIISGTSLFSAQSPPPITFPALAEEIFILLSEKIDRKLTDSEVFGFSQVNSEHCRHKIFNGKFTVDGKEMPSSLFKLIKKTSSEKHAKESNFSNFIASITGSIC